MQKGGFAMLNWFLSLNLIYQLLLAFFTGTVFGLFIMILVMLAKNKKIIGGNWGENY